MFTFLAINGVHLAADADEAWTFLSRLYAAGEFNFEALESWLRRYTMTLDEGEPRGDR